MPTNCRRNARRLEKIKKAEGWQKEPDEVDEALYEDRAPRAQHAAKSAASLLAAEQEVMRQCEAGEGRAQPSQSLGPHPSAPPSDGASYDAGRDFLSLVPDDVMRAGILPLLSWQAQARLACVSSGLARQVRASRLKVLHINVPAGASTGEIEAMVAAFASATAVSAGRWFKQHSGEAFVTLLMKAVACGVALRVGGAPITRLELGDCEGFLDGFVPPMRIIFPALRAVSLKSCSQVTDQVASLLCGSTCPTNRLPLHLGDMLDHVADFYDLASCGQPPAAIQSLNVEKAAGLTAAGVRGLLPRHGTSPGSLTSLVLAQCPSLTGRLALVPPVSCGLQRLNISRCNSLEEVVLSLHHLTSLELSSCRDLKAVVLTTPRLRSLPRLLPSRGLSGTSGW